MALRPNLAVKIATIAATSSGAEALQGMLLAHLSRGDPEALAAVYTSMRNANAQRDSLRAVAHVSGVDPETVIEIEVILKEVKAFYSQRADVIHALWGISEEHPDALINCTIKSYIALHSASHSDFSARTASEVFDRMERINIKNLDMKLYQEADFDAIIQRTEIISSRISKLLPKLKPDRYVISQLLEDLRRIQVKNDATPVAE